MPDIVNLLEAKHEAHSERISEEYIELISSRVLRSLPAIIAGVKALENREDAKNIISMLDNSCTAATFYAKCSRRTGGKETIEGRKTDN